MMVTQLLPESGMSVVVQDGIAYFNGYQNADADVVHVLSEADDAHLAADVLLGIGARAARQASVTLETGIVEKRFENLATLFDLQVQGAVSSISEATNELLDHESGSLVRILADLREGVSASLDATFDADSRSSAIGKIDKVVTDAVLRIERSVRDTVDPGAPESPMARATQSINETVKEQSGALLKEIREINVALAASSARADVEAKTTRKGFRYEDAVQANLEEIATVHGDLAEHTGRTTGTSGNQAGDHCVRLAEDDTSGVDLRIVFESKDKAMTMPKAMAELDRAMRNHDAEAGVMVFAAQQLAPSELPFSWWGNKAVVVFDCDDPDPRALNLAYAWARWMARRSVAAEESEIDRAQIEAAIGAARRALGRHQSIKACHSAARKKIDEGAAHVADLVDDVDEALSDLWSALKATTP